MCVHEQYETEEKEYGREKCGREKCGREKYVRDKYVREVVEASSRSIAAALLLHALFGQLIETKNFGAVHCRCVGDPMDPLVLYLHGMPTMNIDEAVTRKSLHLTLSHAMSHHAIVGHTILRYAMVAHTPPDLFFIPPLHTGVRSVSHPRY